MYLSFRYVFFCLHMHIFWLSLFYLQVCLYWGTASCCGATTCCCPQQLVIASGCLLISTTQHHSLITCLNHHVAFIVHVVARYNSTSIIVSIPDKFIICSDPIDSVARKCVHFSCWALPVISNLMGSQQGYTCVYCTKSKSDIMIACKDTYNKPQLSIDATSLSIFSPSKTSSSQHYQAAINV